MRLLDARTLQFKEFFEDEIPPYAILSHTWGSPEEEVSFQDMQLTPRVLRRRLKKKRPYGYSKIAQTCRLALEDGLDYAWVDTCCIDKSSSAELTEAINSMFRWYEKSNICYVYLADVAPKTRLQRSLKKCRWVTRGWTLQELIAPQDCLFFDSKWGYRGRKTERMEMISRVTGVPAPVLTKARLPQDYTVAQRMSWAAKRTTTRSEDLAYCLLGLFGINMPMIYGEGKMAFRRLQEEIIRRTEDPTIFAWDPEDGSPDFISILAPSPAGFARPQSLMRPRYFPPMNFTLTKQGIKFSDYGVFEKTKGKKGEEYLLLVSMDSSGNEFFCVYLRKFREGLFCRINGPVISLVSRSSLSDPVTILPDSYLADFWTNPITPSAILDSRESGLQILPPHGFELKFSAPRRLWDQWDRCFLTDSLFSFTLSWLELKGMSLGQTVELVLLWYKVVGGARKPVLSIFEKHRFKEHYDYLLGVPDGQFNLTSITETIPALLDHKDQATISLDGGILDVSVSAVKTVVSIPEGDVTMYQARWKIEIQKRDEGESVAASHVNKSS